MALCPGAGRTCGVEKEIYEMIERREAKYENE
jgi:hypothetical protein